MKVVVGTYIVEFDYFVIILSDNTDPQCYRIENREIDLKPGS
jgi:hypothetical protein